jgi:O-antigen/teichoic acid export membrane protein
MIDIHSQGFKRYFANTSWMMAEKIIRMAAIVFVGVYVARYLGPERFGLLNYAISFVALFSGIATLGLDGIVVRNLLQNSKDRARLLGTAFTLKVVGAIVLFVAVSATLYLTPHDTSTSPMILIIAGGMLFKSFNVIEFYFQSTVQARFTTISQFCALVVSSLVQIGLILRHASLVWFAWALVLENVTMGVLLVFMYLKNRSRISKWRFKWQLGVHLLRDSWPLALSGLMIMIYMRIDQIMIKEMLDAKALGYYAAAVRLSEAWYFIPMTITASIFPAIMNAKKISDGVYYDRLQKLFNLMLWIALAVVVPTTFLAEYAITLLYGENYIPAAGVLRIHIWSGIFVFLGVAVSKYLLAENLVMVSFGQAVTGCIANIILNVILIPSYGIKGAAWATLVSYASTIFLLLPNVRARKAFFMMMCSIYPVKQKKSDRCF